MSSGTIHPQRERYRQALDVLTERSVKCYPRKERTRDLEAALQRFRLRHDPWLASRAIQGFGVSYRVRRGKRTRALALMVYVRQKKGRAVLKHPVPRTILIPGLGRFRTDVIQVGQFRRHSFPDTIRPLKPGVSISLRGGLAGTLGCLVRSTKAGEVGAVMMLSCAHVLTNEFRENMGVPVEQAAGVNQPPGGRVGVSSRCARVEFSEDETEFPNEVDAAVAAVDGGVEVDPIFRIFNVRTRQVGDAGQDDVVKKVGWVSDDSSGTVVDPDCKMAFFYPDPAAPGQKRRAQFRNLVRATYVAQKGDSGSIVLNAKNEIVGLHIGSWTQGGGVFCRFRAVAEALEVEPL